MDTKSEKKVVDTVCSLGDGVACGLSVEVSNGVISGIRPAAMPVRSDVGACRKGLSSDELVYHRDRLKYPLKRVGARGEGRWERVSWDEALEDIAGRLPAIEQRYGSRSIAWIVKAHPATLKGGGYSRVASLRKNSWVGLLGFGDAAAPCADMATFGCIYGDPHLSRIADPRLTIIWGQNPDVTDWRRMRLIRSARKGGCKVIVIDPRRTSTAVKAADEYISIRPGTDTALALAMIHQILAEGRQDDAFICEHTVGPLLVRGDNGLFLRESDVIKGGSETRYLVWDAATAMVQPGDMAGVKPELRGNRLISGIECRSAYQLLADRVREYTPESVSDITDIPAAVIKRLAADYGAVRPSSIHRGWGFQRTFHGDLTCRAINTLASLTGNINLHVPSRFALNMKFPLPGGPWTTIPIMALYDQIVKQEPFPVKALWLAGENFVSQLPNQNKIVHELFPRLELIVVSELFMTATARYADYVLPASTPLECAGLQPGLVNWTNSNYLHLQRKAIEPLHESRPDFEIAAGLGRKLGLGKYFEKSEEEYLAEILTSDHPTMAGVSLEGLKAAPVVEPIIEGSGKFNTSTGRIEFYVEKLKPFGQELPLYLEPVESARSPGAQKYPLTLLTSHPRHRIHTVMADCPSMLKGDPEPTLQIHPRDAEYRGIKGGDVVRVFNDRGQVVVKVAVNVNIRPGVVNIDEGWWPEHYIEGHINALTHDRINPAQAAVYEPNAAYCDVLVQVEKGAPIPCPGDVNQSELND